MNSYFDRVGKAEVYRDRRTGRLAVDEDSLHRSSFAGEEPSGASLQGESASDAPSDSGEFGAEPRRSRYPYDARLDRRDDRRDYRQEYRQDYRQDDRRDYRQDYRQESRPSFPPDPRRDGRYYEPQSLPPAAVSNGDFAPPPGWVPAMVSGSATSDGGEALCTIRVQHPFIANDITFEGSLAGTSITKVDFADSTVINGGSGISTSIFTPTSQMRKHLQGRYIAAGLDIGIHGKLEGPGKLCAVIFGFKPANT